MNGDNLKRLDFRNVGHRLVCNRYGKTSVFYYRHNWHYHATIRLRDLRQFDDTASRMHFSRRDSSNIGVFAVSPETKDTIFSNTAITEIERERESYFKIVQLIQLSCLRLLHE